MDVAEVEKLFNRLTKFHARFDTSKDFFQNNLEFLTSLTIMKNANLNIAKQFGLSREALLHRVIADIFDFITEKNPYFAMFSNTDLFGILVESFSYWIVCLYVHTLKRESEQKRAISLSDFVYNNSISGYNIKGGRYYCPPDNYSDYVFSEADTFRKYRHRLFNDRKVQYRNKQWSGMTNDLIHEWRLYYKLVYDSNDKAILGDTFKRVKNLGKEIVKMQNFSFTLDENADINNLLTLNSAMESKLKKIRYMNILALSKVIMKHIQSEEKYYGINMFRLERLMNPYNIIMEVSEMQKCKNQLHSLNVMKRYSLFNDISQFRLLYSFLGSIDPKYAVPIKHSFLNVFYTYAPFFLIVLDDYVENGIFGKDWEDFFLNEINHIASKYYVINDSLFEAESDSQKYFYDLLHFTFQMAYEEKKAECKIYHANRAFGGEH